MWIFLALGAALGSAATSLVLKRAIEHGGVIVSTVVFRIVAGLLIVGLISLTGSWPALTPAYWRTVALVIPPEIAGMVCLTLALRAGDLSLVQPLLGVLPVIVMLGGVVFLNEIPTPLAGVGVVLLTAGVYCVGLEAKGSVLEPIRALARSRASWYAVGAAVFWSITTVLHKVGIAEVGPFPWAVTLTLGSGFALAAALPFLAWKTGGIGWPRRAAPWMGLMVLGGLVFAFQQVGLHLALRIAQAGYVVAISATSTLIATAFGVLLLGERSAARYRVAGGLLVSAGAVLIALFG